MHALITRRALVHTTFAVFAMTVIAPSARAAEPRGQVMVRMRNTWNDGTPPTFTEVAASTMPLRLGLWCDVAEFPGGMTLTIQEEPLQGLLDDVDEVEDEAP